MQKALSKWCRNVRPAMAPLDSKSSLICVRNPATHHILAEIPPCGALEAQEAIATAQKTFRDAQDNNACSKSQDSVTFLRSPTERAHFLYRYAMALSSHREDLAHIITGESGKPLSESLAEVDYAADYIQCFAGEAERIYGHVLPRRGSSTSGSHMFMFHEPVGVVAMITPWNFPLAMLMRKFGAACAAGNTVVAKVSELTPLTAIAAKEIAVRDCGLPEGILNVLYGDAAAIGEVMCSNLGVRVLSFTGSTRVGALLRRNAAIHIRTVMELGGNAPFIVFADADLKLAVRAAMASKFRNAGQTCISPNRFLVHREIHDEFVDALQREMERKLIVGDGMLPGVTMGPLIHVTAAKRVRGDIEEALQHGAVKAWECPQHGAYMTSQEVDSTAFVPPTLLTHCSPKNPIFKKELFAPVVAVTPFETESEAVTLSNQTPYGLASYCFTNDLGRSLRVARLLNVGMVGVNESAISMVHAPFGGIGISGHGREGGQYGVLEYMEMKYCCIKGGESSSSS